jgi:hypothetical protein
MIRFLIVILLPLCAACESASVPMLKMTPTPPSPAEKHQTSSGTTPASGHASFPPTLTLTLTPAPRSFTEDFEGNLPFWSFLQIDLGQPAVGPDEERGFLVFDLRASNQWVYAIYSGQDYADVRVEARFEPRDSEPSSTGLICRYTEKNGWYEFNLSRDGSYNILFGQWLAHDIALYMPILKDKSEYVKPDQNAYEIGLGCLENVLWLYINGKLIRKVDVTRFGLGTGKIGLAAASFENVPVITAFDWIKVSEYISPP